jgi:O-antigen ligase
LSTASPLLEPSTARDDRSIADRPARTGAAPDGGLVFRALIVLILLLPLPLGSVSVLSWWAMASGVALLLIAHGLGLTRAGSLSAETVVRHWPWALPYMAACAWAALQASSLTPPSWHDPLWGEAAALLGMKLAGAISIDPSASLAGVIRLLAYAGIFWLGVQLCGPRRRAERLFLALSFGAFAYSAYGLIDEFSGADTVLWFQKTAYFGTVTSTFINRNSYAAYAGIGLVCASGMLIKLLTGAITRGQSRRANAMAMLQALLGWRGLLVPGWLVLITALLLTDSRGGVTSTLCGLLAFGAAILFSRALRRRHAPLILGLGLLAAVAFALISGARVADRLAATDLEQEGRPLVYALMRSEITRAPWLGSGYGTFAEAFRAIQPAEIKGRWEEAHDTYLENAFELGVPAALLLCLSFLALFYRCVVGLRARRRDAIYPAIGIGVTVLLAFHSLIDFSLQIPAIAATDALIMGAAVAQAWPRRNVKPG